MAEGASTRLTLKDVEKELLEVTDYYSLGLQLNVPQEIMRHLEADYQSNCRRKSEVLKFWLGNAKEASWAVLGAAVERMGVHSLLAESLQIKQGNNTGSLLNPEARFSATRIERRSSVESIYSVYKSENVVQGCKGTDSDIDYQSETRDIQFAFLVLWTQVRRSLDKCGVTVKDFVAFLKGVPAYSSSDRSLFEAVIPELSQKEDLIDILEVLAEYCSWFNYSLLDVIIASYCIDDKVVKQSRESYFDQIRKYCKHRVCKCYGALKNGLGFGRRRNCTHITVKIDEEWSKIRIEQLEEVMDCLGRILKVQRHTLYLRTVNKGCVELIILAPNMASSLFPLSTEQETFLSEAKIVSLCCNDYHFCKSPSELLDSGLGDPRKAAVMEKSVRDSHKVLGSSEVCDSSTDGGTCVQTSSSISRKPTEGTSSTFGYRDTDSIQLHLMCQQGDLNLVQHIIATHQLNPDSVDMTGNMPLHTACLYGHFDVVKYFITRQDVNPECRNISGATPLHAACLNGHTSIAKYLIMEHKCNPHCSRSDKTTPLHFACFNGHLDLVQYLIEECDCNPMCTNSNGVTPLHCACQNGHIELARYLITECKCDPECSTSNDGATPLHYACLNGHLEVAKYLITECGCNLSCTIDGASPLHSACQRGQLDVASYLINEHNCDPNSATNNGTTPLFIACQNGFIDLLHLLIAEHHCDPNSALSDGTSPLHFACLNGHYDIVNYLLTQCKCNPQCTNRNGTTPLHLACLSGYLNIIEYLISEYNCSTTSTNRHGTTPLHAACQNGHTSVVYYLITKQKCNPQCRDKKGVTPLHFACLGGHLSVARYLISEQNCEPNVTDKYGDTPLSFACTNGHLDIAEYLITEHSCRPSSTRVNGATPLHAACANGHINVVKYLIDECNCNPQCKQKDGITPLHLASYNGHTAIVKYLVGERRCFPICTDRYGNTPLSLATLNSHFVIVAYLKALKVVHEFKSFRIPATQKGWKKRLSLRMGVKKPSHAGYRTGVSPNLNLEGSFESMKLVSIAAVAGKPSSPVSPHDSYQSPNCLSAEELSAHSSCGSADEEIFWKERYLSKGEKETQKI